jgi:DNA polymerase III alpha subunit
LPNISSFALYGFPESHAASFAMLAYASAYFKVKYLAAFTCAILNNQPMGFYSPAVLVKDAQRHGLRVKPIDVQISDWPCTVEREPNGSLSLRLGLGYETGIANVIVTPDVYERNRLLVTCSKFLMVEGLLQNQDGVVHVKAAKLATIPVNVPKIDSHDFH